MKRYCGSVVVEVNEICKGKRSGWTTMMKHIWDGKDMSVRTQGSLVLQIKRIRKRGDI